MSDRLAGVSDPRDEAMAIKAQRILCGVSHRMAMLHPFSLVVDSNGVLRLEAGGLEPVWCQTASATFREDFWFDFRHGEVGRVVMKLLLLREQTAVAIVHHADIGLLQVAWARQQFFDALGIVFVEAIDVKSGDRVVPHRLYRRHLPPAG